MIRMKGCASCPMADKCFFAGEAIVVPQECILCIGSSMDRIETENKQLDDAVDAMRVEVEEMEVEMKKTDEKIASMIDETAKIARFVPTNLDALERKYERMMEMINKRMPT